MNDKCEREVCSKPRAYPGARYCGAACSARAEEHDHSDLDRGSRGGVVSSRTTASGKEAVAVTVVIEKKTMLVLRRHLFARALAQSSTVVDAALLKVLDAVDAGQHEVELEAKKDIE